MYHIEATNQFKKDYKLCKKRGLNPLLLLEVLDILEEKGALPAKYKSHTLKGIKRVMGMSYKTGLALDMGTAGNHQINYIDWNRHPLRFV